MKLVDDAKHFWKWGSTYIFAGIVGFPIVWLQSSDLQALLPPSVVSHIAPFVGVGGFLIRITRKTIHDHDHAGDDS